MRLVEFPRAVSRVQVTHFDPGPSSTKTRWWSLSASKICSSFALPTVPDGYMYSPAYADPD